MGILSKANPKANSDRPGTVSEDEWRERLSPEQYRVLRRHGTEMAGSSPLNYEKRAGTFNCAGCGSPLFSSETKYESGSGWPSFWAPLSEDTVGSKTDYLLFYPRTEIHCANCGGHLGHVFNDGPQPTGKRYCMNGVALQFEAQDTPAQEDTGAAGSPDFKMAKANRV
ncbi:MAG: peptide-methionine (R)-S-oxide reductase MsrB [Rhodospirillaceae bacterium]